MSVDEDSLHLLYSARNIFLFAFKLILQLVYLLRSPFNRNGTDIFAHHFMCAITSKRATGLFWFKHLNSYKRGLVGVFIRMPKLKSNREEKSDYLVYFV